MSPLVSTFAGAALRPYGFTTGGAGGNALTLISTAYGTGSSGTITFSSIPSTYKHLQIRAVARSDYSAAVNVKATFNSDTAANYAHHGLYGTGSSVASFGSTSQTSVIAAEASSTAESANIHYVAITDILDYANTSKFKTIRGLMGQSLIIMRSGLWQSTSAISSITLTAAFGNFTTASRFSLYGVLG
jgi:hypothetical protein